MLAQAARNAGYMPLVIDCFGDQDTRQYAEDVIKIPDLAENHLAPAIDELKQRYPVNSGIYGAGFEQHQASLEIFCSHVNVMGNQPNVFSKIHDKPAFFSLLKKLNIPFPDTTFHAPDNMNDWLIKPKQGQGGIGIRHWLNNINGLMNGNRVYWQRFQSGMAHSVLFLADGQRCQISGFNRQWTVALSEADEFVFSGVINHTELTAMQRRQLINWVEQLTQELSLKGLNSLDFIRHDNDLYVLEINPRPPASMQLYDGDLLTLHLNACRGELPEFLTPQHAISGLQVIYAWQKCRIPAGFNWPEGSQDIPNADTLINAGQPICSIINKGDDAAAVMEALNLRQTFIIQHLQQVNDTWNTTPA